MLVQTPAEAEPAAATTPLELADSAFDALEYDDALGLAHIRLDGLGDAPGAVRVLERLLDRARPAS